MEHNASFAAPNNGYSGWTQQPDGTVVVADYTGTDKALPVPVVRAYQLMPSDLKMS